MHIVATKEEMLSIVAQALSTGLPTFNESNIVIEYDEDQYNAARDVFKNTKDTSRIHIEDVQVQMLRMGYGLSFKELDDNDKVTVLNMELIETNWPTVPFKVIGAFYVEEDYDAYDADNLMQHLLFGKIIYG